MATTKAAEAIDTKERLIAAGMEVFAERGYAEAGIREICRRAGANPAAVNYHFGDKQRFYAEVLVTCHRRMVARRDMPRLADDPGRPAKILRAWLQFRTRPRFDKQPSPFTATVKGSRIGGIAARREFIRRPTICIYG